MVSTRWEQVKDVFEAALLQDERDRDSLVSSRCGGDLELIEAVHRLLTADRESTSFLEPARFPNASLLTDPAVDRLLVEGDVLSGRFKVLACLGEGGMGQVYRALDLELRQEIAIKVIRPEIADIPGVLSRFRREVNATRKVTHPNVCRTFDLETHSPTEEERLRFATPITFLTMELLVGETVAERIHRAGPLPPDQLRIFAEQVAHALQAAHSAGVIHCDLKPSNIFITGPESDPRFVVTDFGIAKFTNPQDSPSLTTVSRMSGATEGTPFYMAPEQLENGTSSVASDVYSYGLVLYEVLTGQRLTVYHRSGSEIRTALLTVQNGNSETPQKIDPVWTKIIARCIRSNPANRFADVREILDLLVRGPTEIVAVVPATGAIVKSPERAALESQPRGAPSRWRTLSWSVRTLVLSAAILVPAILIWFLGKHTTQAHSSSAPFSSSVAVMPIHDKENDPRLDALANEITANLTNDLAQMSGIRVPSQSTVRSLGEAPTIQSIRRTLDVDNIVNGNIVRVGGDLALQLELVDARTGFQLWGQSHTRKQMESSSIDEDLAEDIAYQLRMRGDKSSVRKLARQHSSVPAAEQAFLQGRSVVAEHTYPGFERAASLFQQAIDEDPTYAAAIAELAYCYALMAINNSRPEPPLTLMGQAEDTARRALRMDSTQVEAYASLAEIQVLRDYNWGEAEENFKRAEELDPDDVTGHVSYAIHLLVPNGRFAEARVQFTYADREAPKTLRTSLGEATTAYFSRRFEDSINQLEAARVQYHTNAVAIEIEALDYLALRSPDKALKLLVESPPDPSAARSLRDALRGIALARMGRREEALAELKRVEQSQDSSYYTAALCAELGYGNKAMTYLEKSHQVRETDVLYLAVDPLLDPMRPNPQFQALLSALNLR